MTTPADTQDFSPTAPPTEDEPQSTSPVVPAPAAPSGLHRFWPFRSSKSPPTSSSVVPAPAAPSGSQRFWPFTSSKLAFGLAPVLLVALLVGWWLVRTPLQLEQISGGWLLLGIAVLAVLPVVMVVLDGLAAGGGSIEVASVKVALVATAATRPNPVVPSNVTNEPGLSVSDSGSTAIREVLEESARSDIVIVDLGAGEEWWETRLLVACAGAARHGRPRIIVFVARMEDRPRMFVGWVRPAAARDRLLRADRGYAQAFQKASGLALAARLNEASPGTGGIVLPGNTSWMAHDPTNPGTLSPTLDEQLLAAELEVFENPVPRPVGVSRLKELLTPVLHTVSVDNAAAGADWFRTALLQDEDVALTDDGRYVAILPRHAVVTSILLALTGK
jgi:hypothetical protein